MIQFLKRYTARCVLGMFGCTTLSSTQAEPTSQLYSAVPPLLSKNSEPLVMLVMSVDHELFKKAYPDYSDLDGDGQLDTTYNDQFDYLGYFLSDWCYSYNTSSGRFEPELQATGDNEHYCEGAASYWSGNFLNWATMSRIDILRRVLFGGKRSTDTSSATVLERAYLPRDIHSFVKVYSGSDIGKLTPYSNTVSLCNLATSENGEPRVRIASGAWNRWASTEVKQCQWGASNSPSTYYKMDEMTVRVNACVSGKDSVSSRCREYGSNQYKPTGLLQRYGEDGSIRFGLISGSYDRNISGGLLRRNISKIGGNSIASDNEINLTDGTFNHSVKGIIHHINTFRIAKYSYSQNKYTDCSTYGISVSTFKSGRSTSSNRHCSNWGNPIAEMYLEALRYFAGRSAPTPAFNTSSDTAFVSNLATETWLNPLSAANACANCSIILLSTGLNSFDADELGSSAELPGLSGVASVDSKTDEVGNYEYGGSFAGEYLVGGTGSTRQCTAKYLNGLSEARGLCPELPQLEGSYHVSGLAFYGNQTDLRSELEGVQSVKTYAIQLADSMPGFTLNAGGNPVTFQPVCHTSSNFGSGTNFYGSGSDCTLTDVVVEDSVLDGQGNPVEGSLLFTWEDSLWGNDFDYDASSRIKYCVGNQCNITTDSTLKTTGFLDNELRIAVQVDGVYAGLNLRFSYTVTGTYNDGLQSDFVYKGSSGFKANNYVANNGAAGVLPKPLFLAAKYGGFLDMDGDGSPANSSGDSREWDTRNNTTGSAGADGLPDNYFFARNPALLEAQLGQVLQDIASRVSSATNTALLSNSHTGTGVLYQALFQPTQEYNGRTITWGGLLHSLFVDSKGLLREDSNGNDKLDDYATDYIVELKFDPNANQTMLQRYSTDDEGKTQTVSGALQSLSSLKTIWDARDQLAQVQDVITQRHYDSSADSGRYIFTWLDDDNDSVVDYGESLPFTASSFSGRHGYLGVSAAEVTTVVNYVRGEEINGTRSRTIDYNGDGIDEVWRLGDIVHSTPQLVAAPGSRYDALYSDTTYQAFRSHYLNRRHVLYAGANDGMLHAFNGGFWDENQYAYNTTGIHSETHHPLGSELWAYTPMNLLPHLKWLQEQSYPHVYYMDGEPLTFDANIFNAADSNYPGGWGTLLVVGMRLGGGAIDTDVGGTTRTMRSAFVVLDVTNPEQPPKLIAEISHPELGLTTSKPVVVKRRIPDTNSSGEADWSKDVLTNEWYLVFASGPNGEGETGIREAINAGKSDQNLRVFAYDLKTRSFVSGLDPLVSGFPASYAGDLTVVDWNGDYKDDVVYFGSVETSAATLGGELGGELGGKLLRLQIGEEIARSQLSVLVDNGQPVTAAPFTIKDADSYWVYAGTGRLLTYSDNSSSGQQWYYGFKEPLSSSRVLNYNTVSLTNVIDTTDVGVLSNGNLAGDSFKVDGVDIKNFDTLRSVMQSKSGWRIRLNHDGQNPAGRNVSTSSRLFSMLLFTEYQPSLNRCRADGRSYLHAVHYQTGTATPNNVIDYVDYSEDEDVYLSLSKVLLGVGYASAPVIHQGQEGRRSAVTQGAGGSIDRQTLNYGFSSSGRTSWRQIFEIPWLGQ
ncbi:PilC/PilY family type IV pilus protein [Endozoicomonas gorgoniicola]|uniref:PilC/PilY family type IV pilus protein n=1 Tax=Endozoicomonas gorgoniicola TaxID=1234144 RepID=A0ABT3MWT4_9GAMM|nr:PilC/PilY family type IV pilus protein [Endozoicomonas gorgoniicola]MCW7553833.1 PilC/PilY family type IV pilus protein [Endozoicomonas gorgoniicola]